jgi:cytochrome P450
MAFALHEMKVVLARVFARTDLQIASGYVARPIRRAITLAPSRGVAVIMRARMSGAQSVGAHDSIL